MRPISASWTPSNRYPATIEPTLPFNTGEGFMYPISLKLRDGHVKHCMTTVWAVFGRPSVWYLCDFKNVDHNTNINPLNLQEISRS
jgi:hypothetical protein